MTIKPSIIQPENDSLARKGFKIHSATDLKENKRVCLYPLDVRDLRHEIPIYK